MEEKAQETKLYVGAKIIRGTPMDERSFLRDFKGEDQSDREARPGYLVIYPDGYKSWSPKNTFEDAYRLVTSGERALF